MKLRLLKTCVLLLSLLVASSLQAAPDGARLYSRNCAACHGNDGKGGVGVPLALPSFINSVPDSYLQKTIRHGRPGRVMPAFRTLSDAQVRAIVSYVRSFGSAVAPELDPAPISGDTSHGQQLFQQHCAACHGADGRGGKGTGVTYSRPRDLPILAPALNNSGFLTAASDTLIKQTLIKGRAGTPMQSFIKQGLSQQDINDLVAYIRSFAKQSGSTETKRKQDMAAVISVVSPYDFDQTVANVKTAAIAANFKIIRIQKFDQGLVAEGKEDPHRVMVYFCNFPLLNEVLAIDSRVGMFLPCRVTVTERQGKVVVSSINPKLMSSLFNNQELDKACDNMSQVYKTILDEATF
jgi:cytochrome c oxidase cbb3-type subunit 3